MPLLKLLDEDYISEGSAFGDVRIVDLYQPRPELIADWLKTQPVMEGSMNYSLLSGSLEGTDKYALGGCVADENGEFELVLVGSFIKAPNHSIPVCRVGWLSAYNINPKYIGHEWVTWFSKIMIHIFATMVDSFIFSYLVLDSEGYYDREAMGKCIVASWDDTGIKTKKQRIKPMKYRVIPIKVFDNFNETGKTVKVVKIRDLFQSDPTIPNDRKNYHKGKIKKHKEKYEKARLSNQ